MAALNQRGRDVCSRTILHNISHITDGLDTSAYDTALEMVKVGMQRYVYTNQYITTDTLDRYAYSPYGNHNEIVAIMTVLDDMGCGASFSSVEICRTKDEQHTDKVDCKINGITHQVKPVQIGTYKDIFVSLADREGKAQCITYVGNQTREVLIFDKATFDDYCNMRDSDGDLIHPETQHKYAHSMLGGPITATGHYVRVVDLHQAGCRIIPIPDHVLTVPGDFNE